MASGAKLSKTARASLGKHKDSVQSRQTVSAVHNPYGYHSGYQIGRHAGRGCTGSVRKMIIE